MDTIPKSLLRWAVCAAVLAPSAVFLAVAEPEALLSLALRLAPVLLFVAGMSVTVNLASAAGAFEAVARGLERWTRSPWALWSGIVAIAAVSTIFLSLDTTAIMITPMAVALARRNGLKVVPVAFAVVWIANLGSLLLPVSNLTNLLAAGSAHIASETAYMRMAAAPATVALLVAVAASWLCYVLAADEPAPSPRTEDEAASSPALRVALAVLAVIPPALLVLPYWLVSTVAAAVLYAAAGKNHRRDKLVPWFSIVLAATFSCASAAAIAAGIEFGELDPVPLAAAGAVAANAVNNLPAYFLLEPSAQTPQQIMALLIGVNCGPVVTPWASLATLLWHDQLQRAGVAVAWKDVAVRGACLAPFAVAVPLGAMMVAG